MRPTGFLLLLLLAPQDNVVREKYPSGRTRLEYRVDAEGRRHGSYTEYFESGKKRVSATFDRGVADGAWTEYLESGRIVLRKKYEKGRFLQLTRMEDAAGPAYQIDVVKDQVMFGPPGPKPNTTPLFSRSPADLRLKLEEIEGAEYVVEGKDAKPRYAEAPSVAPPHRAGRLVEEYVLDAIRHLNAYRYLAGLTCDVEHDPAKSEESQHGCVVLAVIKELTHTPAQPAGMDEAFFKKGYAGTSRSNLSSFSRTLRHSVDAFMNDSDAKNILKLGHRMWILNPRTKKTGFGQVETWVAQWSIDSSGAGEIPEFNRWPPPGYVPPEYHGASWAWHCRADKSKFQVPAKAQDVRVRMWRLDAEYGLAGTVEIPEVYLDATNIIFKPKFDPKASLADGRFLVEIRGVKRGKEEVPVVYITEFLPGARR